MSGIPTASLGVTADMPRRSVAAPSISAGPPPAAEASVARQGASSPQDLASTHHGLTFHDFLSALNPLQYIPVVGTIYRAVTGDEVSEPARMAGSFVVGGLTAGPFGVATTVASTIFEKITGIDPERVGRSLLASIGVGTIPAPLTPTADDAKMQVTDNSMIDPAAPIDLTCGSQEAVPVSLNRVQATAYASVTQSPERLQDANAIDLEGSAPPNPAILAAAYQRLDKTGT